MKLNGLKKIYLKIKHQNETYGVFDFKTNGVDFDIYFDIAKIPFRLGFLPIGSNIQIWLDVKNGFEIDYKLPQKDYYNLIKLLNLKTNKNKPFQPFNFFKQFDSAIPDNIKTLTNSDRVIITKKITPIEEAEKTIYDGLIEWGKGNSGKKRSPENLEKTRLLLPNVYNAIKDKNISVRYKTPE